VPPWAALGVNLMMGTQSQNGFLKTHVKTALWGQGDHRRPRTQAQEASRGWQQRLARAKEHQRQRRHLRGVVDELAGLRLHLVAGDR
jgi:hypothetical protein